MKSKKVNKEFRVLSRKTIFRGRVVKLELLGVRTPNGRRLERSVIRSRGVAVIIPRISEKRFILVRQLRVAVGQRIWEFPAGTLEKGESLWRCADRELQEETGWRASRIKKLFEYYPTPGISDEKMHVFLADGLRKGTPHKPDDDEDLEVREFSSAQIQRMIRRGEIIDGKTLMGFFFLHQPNFKLPRNLLA